MPRDMFGDVNQPSIKIGNRKWYTVPVSLMSHAAIVLALVAIPLLTPAAMLPPDVRMIFGGPPPVPPEPPPPPARRDDKPKPPSNPTAAPTEAPTEIRPEVPVDPGYNKPQIDIVPGGVETGPPEELPKPKPAPPLDPIRIGGIIHPPMKLAGQQPVYPPIAQQAHVQGVVIIEATIGVDGRVMNAKLLRSIPLLDSAALDAVRTWTYTPTLLNGIPVAVIMTVTVQFSLQ